MHTDRGTRKPTAVRKLQREGGWLSADSKAAGDEANMKNFGDRGNTEIERKKSENKINDVIVNGI